MPRTPDIAQADMRPLIEAELTDIYRSHTKQGDVYLVILITEMQAGIALLGGDGGAATGEYVPAWTFFGRTVLQYAGPEPGGYPLNENNEYVSETPGCSYLILNAVDGSVYDPAVGY